MENKSTTEILEELFRTDKFYADSKQTSIAHVLTERKLCTPEEAMVVARFYTKAATIARRWRRIQQLKPELRGKEWVKRQAKQDDVKKDLGYPVN